MCAILSQAGSEFICGCSTPQKTFFEEITSWGFLWIKNLLFNDLQTTTFHRNLTRHPLTQWCIEEWGEISNFHLSKVSLAD